MRNAVLVAQVTFLLLLLLHCMHLVSPRADGVCVEIDLTAGIPFKRQLRTRLASLDSIVSATDTLREFHAPLFPASTPALPFPLSSCKWLRSQLFALLRAVFRATLITVSNVEVLVKVDRSSGSGRLPPAELSLRLAQLAVGDVSPGRAEVCAAAPRLCGPATAVSDDAPHTEDGVVDPDAAMHVAVMGITLHAVRRHMNPTVILRPLSVRADVSFGESYGSHHADMEFAAELELMRTRPCDAPSWEDAATVAARGLVLGGDSGELAEQVAAFQRAPLTFCSQLCNAWHAQRAIKREESRWAVREWFESARSRVASYWHNTDTPSSTTMAKVVEEQPSADAMSSAMQSEAPRSVELELSNECTAVRSWMLTAGVQSYTLLTLASEFDVAASRVGQFRPLISAAVRTGRVDVSVCAADAALLLSAANTLAAGPRVLDADGGHVHAHDVLAQLGFLEPVSAGADDSKLDSAYKAIWRTPAGDRDDRALATQLALESFWVGCQRATHVAILRAEVNDERYRSGGVLSRAIELARGPWRRRGSEVVSSVRVEQSRVHM